MLIELGTGRFLESDEILFVANLDSMSETLYLDRLKKERSTLSVVGARPDKSVIITKNGLAIFTNMRAETIMKKIKKDDV